MFPLPRRVMRDVRLMVPLCIVLICGSFAAAALLSLRLDRAHALDAAAAFAQSRAGALAAVAAANLDRIAAEGRAFATDPAAPLADPAIAGIAVFNADGMRLAARGAAPAPPAFNGARAVVPGGIALRDQGRIVALRLTPAAFAPAALLDQAAIAAADGQLAAGAVLADAQSAPVPGWPFQARAAADTGRALAAWIGNIPLYLFVILGPAVAAGWLAALFVGSFERQQRATRRLRELKAMRPAEPKLLVRLAAAERGAAEAVRAKSEFIAHMSHELRTPLNAVIGFSEIIAEGLYGPAGHAKYTEYARDITGAGRALHTKIDNILEFANIEAGRFPLALERVDLAALAQDCVAEHQGRAFSRRITLLAVFCEPGLVRADPGALRRVLGNLIGNALAYGREGGAVRLDVRFEDGAGLVTLQDSGPGFSPAEQARAGQPFRRFDRPGTVTGAGLGLAIAMELTRRMGGAMRLCGHAAGGSVMEVRLPRL